MNLSREEMETHLNMTGDDHSVWTVYSDDPVMQRRIESIGAVPVKVAADGIGKHYILRANQISFRKGNAWSEEHKAQMADRMRALRKSQKDFLATNVRIDSENGGKE